MWEREGGGERGEEEEGVEGEKGREEERGRGWIEWEREGEERREVEEEKGIEGEKGREEERG